MEVYANDCHMNRAGDEILALITSQIKMIEMVYGITIQNPEEVASFLRSRSENEQDAFRYTAALNTWVARYGIQPDLVISRRVLENIIFSAVK